MPLHPTPHNLTKKQTNHNNNKTRDLIEGLTSFSLETKHFYVLSTALPSSSDTHSSLSNKHWLATSRFSFNNFAISFFFLLRNWSSTACTCVVSGTYESRRGGGCPYTALNGVIPVDECALVLYHRSAKGSHLTRSLGLLPTKKHPRYVSRQIC